MFVFLFNSNSKTEPSHWSMQLLQNSDNNSDVYLKWDLYKLCFHLFGILEYCEYSKCEYSKYWWILCPSSCDRSPSMFSVRSDPTSDWSPCYCDYSHLGWSFVGLFCCLVLSRELSDFSWLLFYARYVLTRLLIYWPGACVCVCGNWRVRGRSLRLSSEMCLSLF